MRILVGTPTYNGQLTSVYTGALLALQKELGEAFEWSTTNGTLIGFARNVLASRVLEGGHSHLLFVDSDIEFQPPLIRRMLAFNEPIVAATYPKRMFDMQRFYEQARVQGDAGSAWARSLHFLGDLEVPHVARDNFYRATTLPTGLMLIKREALERLRDALPDLYKPARGTYYETQGIAHVLQCFDAVYETNGVAYGEDISFCRRWRDLGGELWMTFDDTVGHFGPHLFRPRP